MAEDERVAAAAPPTTLAADEPPTDGELTSNVLSLVQHVSLWQAVVVLALIAGLHPGAGLRTALLVLSAVIGAALLVSDGLARRHDEAPPGHRGDAAAVTRSRPVERPIAPATGKGRSSPEAPRPAAGPMAETPGQRSNLLRRQPGQTTPATPADASHDEPEMADDLPDEPAPAAAYAGRWAIVGPGERERWVRALHPARPRAEEGSREH